MKKTIQKPENWQDFETLCKQLWGEIWSIPMKIKKNGRNGQSQAGVDVYGVPKGEENYWGIQCKGKDDYANAKLTQKEIDNEITKALKFRPKLAVFIFATTMNKDSSIEEYVRLKDIESRKNGGFEILLYCWEDIADLIDDHQETYNFWVGNKQHKTKFGFEVTLNDNQNEFIINPRCIRTIKRYEVRDCRNDNYGNVAKTILENVDWKKSFSSSRLAVLGMHQRRVNEAICSFKVTMTNTGTCVIENWKVRFTVAGEHKRLMDQLGVGPMGMIDLSFHIHKRTHIENNRIFYSPKDNVPLIQTDSRSFDAYVIPKCENYVIPVEWELLARDYNSTGTIFLKVEPVYEDRIITEFVESEMDLKEDEIISVEEKKNYRDEN